jgi:hypothetical protein
MGVMVAMVSWRAKFWMRRWDSIIIGIGLTVLHQEDPILLTFLWKHQEDPILKIFLRSNFWRSAVAGCFALCNA